MAYQINNLIKSLEYIDDEIIITGANADNGGAYINRNLRRFSNKNKKIHFFPSLGTQIYLSILKFTKYAIGNSSSLLVELPSYGVYGLNIGNRQKGRIQGDNIINVQYNYKSIIKGIKKVNKLNKKKKFKNPYYKKDSSKKIINHLKSSFINHSKEKILKKQFNAL